MNLRYLVGLSLLALVVAFVGCSAPAGEDHSEHQAAGADTDETAPPAEAAAALAPTEGNQVTGTVTFTENNGKIHVTAKVNGLTPGKHGFHIHENGDCSAPDGTSAGGHFNPHGTDHGGPEAATHHIGDLGNLEANADGYAEYHGNWGFLSIGEGAESIVGKAVIVHAGEDDLVSQPTGDAGGRLACGVIQRQ